MKLFDIFHPLYIRNISSVSITGSIALAKILYSDPFTYTIDVSGNNILTNAGSSAINDGLMYTGESLEVGATQVFDMPIDTDGQCVAIYNAITPAWVYTTSTTSPSYTIPKGTYGHMAVLAIEPSATAKTYLENNIHGLADLWFDEIDSIDNIVKADIQHFYIPKVEQGSALLDLITVPSNITIPNYASTMYTNADQNQKSQQTAFIDFDSTGRALGVDYSTIKFHNNDYVDTLKIPDQSFTIEVDVEWSGLGDDHIIGCGPSDGVLLINGYLGANSIKLFCFNGGWVITEVATKRIGRHTYKIVRENGIGQFLYEDGILIGQTETTTPLTILNAIKLGHFYHTYHSTSKIHSFMYDNKI